MELAIYPLVTLLQTTSSEFNNYLLLGYGVMWLVALVYLIRLASTQRNLRQDIELMQRLLEEEEKEEH